MLMISSRENFWDSNELSYEDEIKEVILDDDSQGDPVVKEQFLDRIKGKKVLFLIHGYNNEEDDVVRAYSIIEENIASNVAGQYDMIIGYTWPGGDDKFDYYAAKGRASAVAPRVRRWLRAITEASATTDVMTHSMGGRVILLAFKGKKAPKVRNLFTMAPAVDNESIQINESYYNSSKACKTLYTFHSINDPVLRKAYRLAEWDRALGYSGPEDPAAIIQHSPNVKVINCKRVIKRHGGYKDSDEVFGFMKNELTGRRKTKQYSTL